MYKASVSGKTLEVNPVDEGFSIDGKFFKWNPVKISDGYFHLVLGNKGYRAEVVSLDAATKTAVIKVNGHSYTVELKDKFDLLLEKMGMNASAGSKVNNIKAPMPGLIIELKVKTGDVVKAGDQLLILEAMKMENIIKSPGAGTVKNVKIKKGDSVEKGQVLLEF